MKEGLVVMGVLGHDKDSLGYPVKTPLGTILHLPPPELEGFRNDLRRQVAKDRPLVDCDGIIEDANFPVLRVVLCDRLGLRKQRHKVAA